MLGQIEQKVDTRLREWTNKLRDNFLATGKSRDFNMQMK